MTIGKCSVKTLARALVRKQAYLHLSRMFQVALAQEIVELVNAIVARELAKAQKGKK